MREGGIYRGSQWGALFCSVGDGLGEESRFMPHVQQIHGKQRIQPAYDFQETSALDVHNLLYISGGGGSIGLILFFGDDFGFLTHPCKAIFPNC